MSTALGEGAPTARNSTAASLTVTIGTSGRGCVLVLPRPFLQSYLRMLTRRTRLDRPGRFETGATAKAVARAGTGRYPLPTQPTNPPVVRLRLAERNCRFRP